MCKMLLDSSAIDIYMFSPQTPATVPDFWKRGLLYQSRPDFIIFFFNKYEFHSPRACPELKERRKHNPAVGAACKNGPWFLL